MTCKPFADQEIKMGHPKWETAIMRQLPLYQREEDLRSPFYRDYSRILHSQPYSRLKHKTQVFFAPQNDHICTRIEHVNHVASVSYSVAKNLGLNTELTQAIAAGHDLGHAPFGHEGEFKLHEIAEKVLNEDFWHEKQGLWVVDHLTTLPNNRNQLENLNLTYAVRDGIISHCGEVDENSLLPRSQAIALEEYRHKNQYAPFTWEGCVVKIADKIAYLGRDIEDAMRLGLLSREALFQLKKVIRSTVNLTTLNNTILMHHLIVDLCKSSTPEKGLGFSHPYLDLLNGIKQFNYVYIYDHPRIEAYKRYCHVILETIFEVLFNWHDGMKTLEKIERQKKDYPRLTHYFSHWLVQFSNMDLKKKQQMRILNKQVYDLNDQTSFARAVLDFISGMTDNFAIRCFNEIITF